MEANLEKFLDDMDNTPADQKKQKIGGYLLFLMFKELQNVWNEKDEQA